MKYLRYLLILTLFLCINTTNVNALSCSNAVSKDLGKIASYVKTSYEVIDKSETKELTIGEDKTNYLVPKYNFEISIYNITSDIYVTIKNDIDDREVMVTSSDATDGTYTFINRDFGRVYNYEIVIYSANNDCYGEKIKTLKLVKPMYNAYSEYTYCRNSSNYYCQKFTNTNLNIKNTSDFLQKIKVNNSSNAPKDENNENENSVGELLKKNWKIYLIVFVIVIIITIAIIIVIRKRNKSKGWEL